MQSIVRFETDQDFSKSVIWTVAILLILVWPPQEGRSLIVKAVNWAADPSDSLPSLPATLYEANERF
jgi:hypothetical protein